MIIRVAQAAGNFAENKEVARQIRTSQLLPALKRGDDVTLDFSGVTVATQSFVHALIAEAIRTDGLEALDRMTFARCTMNVQAVIEVVVSYCQDDWAGEPDEG